MNKTDFKIERPDFPEYSVNITEFGAIAYAYELEDSRNNAKAINNAMAAVSEKGGGRVVVPAGIWVTGPIKLMDNVNLHLEAQSVLKFSKNIEEYPLILTNYEGQECIRTVSPITADHVSNIAITGKGVIDGSGDLWRPVKQFKLTDRQWQERLRKSKHVIETKEGGIWMPTESVLKGNEKNIQKGEEDALKKAEKYYDFYRPVMVSLRYCNKVLLQETTFMNSPAWNIHPFFCTNLTVENVQVKNPYYAQNGDGIDVESCTNVEICGSTFETGDDAICIKSGKNAEARTFEGPCSNIYIHDCVVNEGHGGFVVGSEMSRGVHNVLVEDCTFMGTDVGVRFKSALGRGGVVENIEINNINMTNIKEEAVVMTMSYVLNSLNRNETIAKADEADVPYFRNISMSGIHCMGAGIAVKIEPLEGKAETISGITIKDSVFVASKETQIAGENVVIAGTEFK
ncbi:MAG: glycoside hydrolase family 28 protein [Eubacteriales bacterium]|nr:glycoside hydrolase family 28 protein [Eubacteriales bacterium]